MTVTELVNIKKQLDLEQVLIKKYTVFAQLCTDQMLKTACEKAAAEHKNHYVSLLNQLN